MGRQMPVECEHGVIVDGGDFAVSSSCPDCTREAAARAEEHAALEAKHQPRKGARCSCGRTLSACEDYRRLRRADVTRNVS